MAEEKIIEITDMDLVGRGIGRGGGKAVFIPGTVPGDRVLYTVVKREKRYDVGKVIEIISPSPKRIVPLCKGFGNCGGCTFLGIERSLELDIKRRAVESAFRRAGLSDVSVPEIISGSPTAYRNKAVFHFRDGKYGFKSADGKSIYSGNCSLVPNIFNKILRFAEEYLAISPTTPPESIMLRMGGDGVMICTEVKVRGESDGLLQTVRDRFPDITSVYECIGYPTARDARYFHLWGDSHITTSFAGVTLRVSAPSFFQVNEEIAAALVGEICDFADPGVGDTVLDLYCGIGSITLPVAKRFPGVSLLGIEINPAAVEDARRNAALSGISNAEFICGDAGRSDLSATTPHTVIVDPPRFGLTDSMIASILKIRPDTLIYMSCNPSTLAGNALKLIRGGYTVKKCIAADMFPGTAHVECVVMMTKS